MTIRNLNNRRRRHQRRLVHSTKGLIRLYHETNYSYGHAWQRCKPRFVNDRTRWPRLFSATDTAEWKETERRIISHITGVEIRRPPPVPDFLP